MSHYPQSYQYQYQHQLKKQYESDSPSQLLNNKNSSRYFNNINEYSVYKKYLNTKANSNKCSRNNKCKKKTSKYENKTKLTKTKAKIGLQTLSYGYKKKIKNMLTNMIGLIKSTITKKEIVEIADSLDILNKVYNEPICESGITMSSETKNNSYFRSASRNSKAIDIYSYLIKQMKDKTTTIPINMIQTFIENIKYSNKSNTNLREISRFNTRANKKTNTKTDSDYEYNMNYNNNLKSLLKSVLETLPVCKTS